MNSKYLHTPITSLFCAMHRLKFILVSFCILTNLKLLAQQQFDHMQREVLESSANQWLCKELRLSNPGYFDCSRTLWTLPKAGEFLLFGEPIVLEQQHIDRFQQLWFPNGDCNQYLSVVAMADLYGPLFKRKAEQLHLHPDIALLPLVLSGCNQQFRYEDFAGLWAMTTEIARRQKLRVDTLVDERLGGDFTTDAALKYIAYLSSEYSGDYMRVSVAYRWGMMEVADTDFALRGLRFLDALRPELADYLRFQAYTFELFRFARSENQLNNCFDILGHFQPVIIDKPILIKAIAHVLNVDEERIRSSNPVYTGSFLMPGYRKVPFVLEDTIMARFKNSVESIANWKPSKD